MVLEDPLQSIPLLDEHEIRIEYLENLENLMFQKYFKLASMIDPIIDNCYHIQIDNWKNFRNSNLNQVSADESLGKKYLKVEINTRAWPSITEGWCIFQRLMQRLCFQHWDLCIRFYRTIVHRDMFNRPKFGHSPS